MKSYIKPTIDFIKLTIEERFAAGSGTAACTLAGYNSWVDKNTGIVSELPYYVGQDG